MKLKLKNIINEQNFASGTTYPYRLFINVGNHDSSVTSVLNKTFVDSVQLFLQDLTNEPDTTKGGLPNGTIVTSYMWSTDLPKDLGGPSIDYFFINAALSGTLGPRKNINTDSKPSLSKQLCVLVTGSISCPSSCLCMNSCINSPVFFFPPVFSAMGPFLIKMINEEFTNDDKTSAIVEIALGIPPFSVAGRKWLEAFRHRLHLAALSNASYSAWPMDIAGFGGDVNDSLNGVYSSWP